MKSSRILVMGAALMLQGPALAADRDHRGAAQNGTGYYVPNLNNGSGTSTPIMEVPGSVVVVPQQVLQDQQSITVCDALRNVSGVTCR